MNDAGLQSGIYHQLREYSSLLSRYLISLKTEAAAPSFTPPTPIAELIKDLGEKFPVELSVQMLASRMQESGTLPTAVLGRLRSGLDHGQRYHELIADLETLARYLSAQQAGAFARLRSSR